MNATIDQFQKLLNEFKELPPTLQRDPTTLELSGYPHLENVYSNILAFFLDPEREHGFGPLFLKSLLSVAKCKAMQDGEKVEVNREEITETRKQIDLVISTDTLIVGIENKIYNPLHNDFEDYRRHIEERANGRRVCKILLGLKWNLPEDGRGLSGFKPITYQDYFDEVLRQIGPTLIGSSDRYLQFALEVIETVKYLTEGSAMKPEMLAFFQKNEEGVDSLLQEVKKLKDEMRNRVKDLRTNFKPGCPNIAVYLWRQNHKLRDSVWYEIKIEDGFTLEIYTFISPKGWKIKVLTTEGNFQRVKSWLEERQGGNWIEEKEEGYRYQSDPSPDLPYNTDISEVVDQVRPLIESARCYFSPSL